MESRDDGDLVARAAEGSELAFRELYRAYVRPVYWLAHGLVGNAQDAEDVTQETFLVAWRKLSGLELAGRSLLPWLATICRFQAANRSRRQRRERDHSVADGTRVDELQDRADVVQQVVDAELVELILHEVRGMDPIDQGIFRLCAVDGLGYREAAEALGISHGAVRNRLSRIRGRLRLAAADDPTRDQPAEPETRLREAP